MARQCSGVYSRMMFADTDLAPTIWNNPAGVFAQLSGSWSLTRTLSTGASMTGEAIFTPRNDGALAYRETGKLQLPSGQTFDADRRYIYRGTDDGFSVFFAEQSEELFHRIVLHGVDGVLCGHAHHPCRADIYLSRYEFRRDRSFTLVHDVSGPTKNYQSQTLFRR